MNQKSRDRDPHRALGKEYALKISTFFYLLGAEEACLAHNQKVSGSKPLGDNGGGKETIKPA